ncbi:hypothetical protein D1007_06498 [Hordeum vulgare]|nr:hypothetical protein D1007_06498 [Hordeum vulgare]
MRNRPFWNRKQLSVYNDILNPRENLFLPHVKSIDVEYLQRNERYFGTALSLCEKLGILNIMQFNKDFDVEIIVVLFATIHLGTDEDRTLSWMANGGLLFAPSKSFMQLLNIEDEGVENPLGFHPHREIAATHKQALYMYKT